MTCYFSLDSFDVYFRKSVIDSSSGYDSGQFESCSRSVCGGVTSSMHYPRTERHYKNCSYYSA